MLSLSYFSFCIQSTNTVRYFSLFSAANKSAARCGHCCYWWSLAHHSQSGCRVAGRVKRCDISVSKKDLFSVVYTNPPRQRIQ